ncbi:MULTISPECIES: hypothetical protein [unclassified Pseudofrankia]|uniref:hypothetical protein n=1 Tax=unclassified Pseudofrankia TaxID=2994372 RepID=UPI0008DACB13|nr:MULTISPECIES: hypothetical protein [unclassified Pseudofrankia]MDT3440943.1 hypothetical protein [Pseudofrankia sp. BMG5.37]OHV45290.1 hypothetical protein BCD48_22800 [Pseudofrankia sp. BMG5.36]
MSGEKPVERDGGRPGDQLTGGQVGILLTLMAEARPVPNPELAARFRLSLDGADRRRLNGLGLVTSRRAGRSYVHELTAAGWARCRRELATPPAGRAGSIPSGAVHALLAALAGHLDRTGLTLADLFRPPPAGGAEAGAGEAGHEVDQRIRTVYGTLARWPGDWVRLADLRPRLGADLTRADVDAALRRMNRGPGVTVAPDEDQKALTGADQREAVEIGGQAKHLIMVEG